MFKSSRGDKSKSKDEPTTATEEQPLLVFVNSKSGGRQGESLLPKFRALLPHDHVVDLLEDFQGPRPACAPRPQFFLFFYSFTFFIRSSRFNLNKIKSQKIPYSFYGFIAFIFVFLNQRAIFYLI
jgi:hypothetical protein